MAYRVKVVVREQTIFDTESGGVLPSSGGCIAIGLMETRPSFLYMLRQGEYAKITYAANGDMLIKVDE